MRRVTIVTEDNNQAFIKFMIYILYEVKWPISDRVPKLSFGMASYLFFQKSASELQYSMNTFNTDRQFMKLILVPKNTYIEIYIEMTSWNMGHPINLLVPSLAFFNNQIYPFIQCCFFIPSCSNNSSHSNSKFVICTSML